MEQENQEKNVKVEEVISKSEQFVVKNQKTLIIVVAAILVVVLGFFGLRRFYFQPRQEKANDAIFAAEQYLAQNDYKTALEGNDKHAGFLEVVDRYGNTKAGKRAKYEAGLCYLHMGNYENAAKMLKSYKGKDTFTPILAKLAEGDAECELGNNANALKLYNQAAKMDDNFITTPMALFKTGMIEIMQGNGENAKAAFQKIKEQYPESTEYRDIDKYITWAENL